MKVLNKYDKEELVTKMHANGRTTREIASTAHNMEIVRHNMEQVLILRTVSSSRRPGQYFSPLFIVCQKIPPASESH
jgi:hypothetical protein